MSKKTSIAASAASAFAHLLNFGAAPLASADDSTGDDPKEQRADESDEEYAKRMEEDDRKQREGESDEEHAKRMKAMDDEAADDDDNGDGESEKEKAARQRERTRCARIFQSPAAAVRGDMAAHLAFNTSLSARAAIDMLNVTANGGAPRPAGLASRMAGVRVPNPGAGATAEPVAASSPQAKGDAMLAAAKKARGG